jgi:hypothetical protein
MANLTSLLYPVSSAITNVVTARLDKTQPVYENTEVSANKFILIGTATSNEGQVLHTSPYNPLPIAGTVSLEVNTNNCVLSSTGMPGTPALSSQFTNSGIIMHINGASYNTRTSYLQVRVNNNNFANATLVLSKILLPNENFEITIPYGIKGNPFHVVVCDSPVQPTLTDSQTFFSVNYKK